jgi:hypothetical protein
VLGEPDTAPAPAGKSLRELVATDPELAESARSQALSILDAADDEHARLMQSIGSGAPRARISEQATQARNAAFQKVEALLGKARFARLREQAQSHVGL